MPTPVPTRPQPNRRDALLAASAALAWPAAAQPSGSTPPDPTERLADLLAALRPAVLPVGTWSATDSPRFGFKGSGFAIGDGSLIATCAHVLPAAGQVEVLQRLSVLAEAGSGNASQRTPRAVQVLSVDRARDLAILKLSEGPPLPVAMQLADARSAREGHDIAILGYPIGSAFGYATVTHKGSVASITTLAVPAASAQTLDPRAIARMREGNAEILQLDAVAYPGNSGGPVIDARHGRVVGVLNMVLVKGSRESALSNPTGIAYAVPVRYLHELLRSL